MCVFKESGTIIYSSLLEAGQIRKKGYFGEKGMQKESDSWKENQHARMHG